MPVVACYHTNGATHLRHDYRVGSNLSPWLKRGLARALSLRQVARRVRWDRSPPGAMMRPRQDPLCRPQCASTTRSWLLCRAAASRPGELGRGTRRPGDKWSSRHHQISRTVLLAFSIAFVRRHSCAVPADREGAAGGRHLVGFRSVSLRGMALALWHALGPCARHATWRAPAGQRADLRRWKKPRRGKTTGLGSSWLGSAAFTSPLFEIAFWRLYRVFSFTTVLIQLQWRRKYLRVSVSQTTVATLYSSFCRLYFRCRKVV